ncbi:GNAT family N-acetyltransferase [Lacticigenium naphthae]|uniref:GNAT family N-acetyltransferase n=1 Tax=Lacticigenium naphthae TaxID=515351 RepID=UPI0003FE666C|nr:GNAT family N-acetyltransferase [Lacticigenium naphthae]
MNFHSIEKHSLCIEKNEFYELYLNEKFSFMYDYNAMYLLFQPVLEEFLLIENIQFEFHKDIDFNYMKFYWPANTPFTPEIMNYFNENNYGIEMLELYTVFPEKFKITKKNSAVRIEWVTDFSLPDYKKINFQQDLHEGVDFAEKKQAVYDINFHDSSIYQIIAYLDNIPVGGTDIIEKDKTIEIDNLFVCKEYRKQGIGSEIQQFIMKHAKDKQILLLADGEETARNMYRKQNYQYEGYRLAAQKEFNKNLGVE